MRRASNEVARQRDEYGGTNWGAAFFGWLVATGLAALLTALVSAAGAAIAFSEIDTVGEAANRPRARRRRRERVLGERRGRRGREQQRDDRHRRRDRPGGDRADRLF